MYVGKKELLPYGLATKVTTRRSVARRGCDPVVRRGHLQGPSRVSRHQIDLFWTSTDGVSEFLCIANAKFMKKRVSLKDLMTLLGVQRTVKAHKAMLITNTGYSAACIAQAREDGVALLVVRPAADFDPGVLPVSGEVPVAELEKVFNRRFTPAYRVRYVHKGFEVTRGAGVTGANAPVSGSGSAELAGGGGGGWEVPPGRPAGVVAVPNKMVSSPAPSAGRRGLVGIRRK